MEATALYAKFLDSTGVSTDTRKIAPGNLFFALKGTNFNGNLFAKNALDAGASYAVIDEERYARSDRYILVPNALQALQALARHHRNQFTIPVFALTGSNGKTTTKELIHVVLEKRYRTHATSGNLNNHIGVPLTLLHMPADTEVAIVEMGANKVGDIAELCAIANPTHGLITNIGRAHIEGFGGVEGIIRGKSELFQHLRQYGGTVFINANDDVLLNMAKRFNAPKVFPRPGDYLHCTFNGANPYIVYTHESGQQVHTQLIGSYNFNNIAAALAVGKFFEVPPGDANAAVANYRPTNNRSQMMTKGSNTIILDAYNANPTSMRAALQSLKEMTAPQKGVVLGDMFELGPDEASEHQKVGMQLAGTGFGPILLCGPRMQAAKEACPEAQWFHTKEALLQYVAGMQLSNTTLLIKASRSMGLEKVVEVLP